MKARVVDGTVVETRSGGTFDDAWIDCPDSVFAGCTFDGATWSYPPMPRSVTPRQGKVALYNAGLLGQIESRVAANPLAKIEWDNAQEFRRDWPLLAELAAESGLSDSQIDALFDAAELL